VEDYPRNLSEFDTRFASEEACREYLFKLRWPDGFRAVRPKQPGDRTDFSDLMQALLEAWLATPE
jgi:hypothetical protein